MLIGLVGKIGSGKDSVAEILLKKFDFQKQIRFSDPITEFLENINLKLNRENYQKVGFYLRDIFGRRIIVDTIVNRIRNISEENIIVNGIRFRIEFEAIKNLNGKTIGIITEDKIRFQRVNERKRFGRIINWEEFHQYEQKETEIQIGDLLKKTDLTIYNSGSLLNLEEEINNLMNKINFK